MVARTPAVVTLDDASIKALASAIVEGLAPIVAKPAKSAATSDAKPLSAVRKSDAHVCPVHTTCGKLKNGHFATEKGLAWHVEHAG